MGARRLRLRHPRQAARRRPQAVGGAQAAADRQAALVQGVFDQAARARQQPARAPDQYLGKIFAPEGVKELSIRAGHIPQAENVPWATIVNEDGTYKPLDEIRKIYADKGVDGSKPVITYCRIGERSSHSWFALKRLLGYEVRNYDGSWTEYGNAVGVPVTNKSGTVWLGK